MVLSFTIFWLESLCMSLQHPCYMSCPFGLHWFEHPHDIWWCVKVMIPINTQLFLPATFSLVGPNIFLSTFFSDTHNPHYMQIHNIKKKRKYSNNTWVWGVQHKLLMEASLLFHYNFSRRSNLVAETNTMYILNIIFICTKY